MSCNTDATVTVTNLRIALAGSCDSVIGDSHRAKGTAPEQSGSVAVELAMLLPIYIILLLATYYIGNGFLTKHKLRSSARTYAENRGGWPVGVYLKDIIDRGMYEFQMSGYSTLPYSLDLQDEKQWSGGDSFYSQYVEDMTVIPLGDGVPDDVGRALRGNNRFDPDLGWHIGGHISRHGTEAEALAAMLEYDTTGVVPEGEHRPLHEIYWQWYWARARYRITGGGGPGFAALIAEAGTYRHLMEVNITNRDELNNTGRFDYGPYNGRMPNPMHLRLEPSDMVQSPQGLNRDYPAFGPPELEE